jgi:hypothetical protein
MVVYIVGWTCVLLGKALFNVALEKMEKRILEEESVIGSQTPLSNSAQA